MVGVRVGGGGGGGARECDKVRMFPKHERSLSLY